MQQLIDSLFDELKRLHKESDILREQGDIDKSNQLLCQASGVIYATNKLLDYRNQTSQIKTLQSV